MNKQHAVKLGLYPDKKGINAKPPTIVEQLDLNGNSIRVYESLSQAEKHTGIGNANISVCVNPNSPRKTAGGFIWRKIGIGLNDYQKRKALCN